MAVLTLNFDIDLISQSIHLLIHLSVRVYDCCAVSLSVEGRLRVVIRHCIDVV